jgi:hypothetical protein
MIVHHYIQCTEAGGSTGVFVNLSHTSCCSTGDFVNPSHILLVNDVQVVVLYLMWLHTWL